MLEVNKGEFTMNIYKIWREDDIDYDTYDSAIVIADNEEYAIKIHPNGYAVFKFHVWMNEVNNSISDCEDEWCSIDNVKVELIGVADEMYAEPCVIVSSFNAG